MTTDLHRLYQQTVVEHGRRPRNRRVIQDGQNSEQHNPLCGDRITVYVRVEDAVIRDVSFEGAACAITIAAASLMTEALKNQSVAHAEMMSERLRRLLSTPGDSSSEGLGALAALGGVRQFPMRVRCALLPWQALHAAVAQARCL